MSSSSCSQKTSATNCEASGFIAVSYFGTDDGRPGGAAWALPVQRRHLDTALSGVARLAELRDPTGPRWG